MNINKDFSIEERVQLAQDHFLSGYNCAQSVFIAYADLIGIDKETAIRLSVSFGGGMGRMREVCGSVSAMFMITGFKYEVNDPSSQLERKQNYAKVQELAEKFRELNGSIICRELLSLQKGKETNPAPSPRTHEYYRKRPCTRFITDGARLVGKMLQED